LLAIADLDRPSEQPATTPKDLRAKLATLDRELTRLTEAIKLGTRTVPLLVKELETAQRSRDAISALLAPAPARPRLDQTALRLEVEERLADWQGALRRNRPQGRQLLRKLLEGRLRFTPGPEGVIFEGRCSLGQIIHGLATTKSLVSRPGLEPGTPCL